jgi:hypothetical protein
MARLWVLTRSRRRDGHGSSPTDTFDSGNRRLLCRAHENTGTGDKGHPQTSSCCHSSRSAGSNSHTKRRSPDSNGPTDTFLVDRSRCPRRRCLRGTRCTCRVGQAGIRRNVPIRSPHRQRNWPPARLARRCLGTRRKHNGWGTTRSFLRWLRGNSCWCRHLRRRLSDTLGYCSRLH